MHTNHLKSNFNVFYSRRFDEQGIRTGTVIDLLFINDILLSRTQRSWVCPSPPPIFLDTRYEKYMTLSRFSCYLVSVSAKTFWFLKPYNWISLSITFDFLHLCNFSCSLMQSILPSQIFRHDLITCLYYVKYWIIYVHYPLRQHHSFIV